MSELLTILFYAGLIALAYKVGGDPGKGPRGVAVFVVGLILFQMFVYGPSSLFDASCATDWDGRSNPTYCD